MSKIIDIHGQQDNRNLLDSSNHIEYLDSFIGNDIIEIKTKYRELYEKYIEIDKKIKAISFAHEIAFNREKEVCIVFCRFFTE